LKNEQVPKHYITGLKSSDINEEVSYTEEEYNYKKENQIVRDIITLEDLGRQIILRVRHLPWKADSSIHLSKQVLKEQIKRYIFLYKKVENSIFYSKGRFAKEFWKQHDESVYLFCLPETSLEVKSSIFQKWLKSRRTT